MEVDAKCLHLASTSILIIDTEEIHFFGADFWRKLSNIRGEYYMKLQLFFTAIWGLLPYNTCRLCKKE